MSHYVVAVVITTSIYRKVEAETPGQAIELAHAGEDTELGQVSSVTGAYIVNPESIVDPEIRKKAL